MRLISVRSAALLALVFATPGLAAAQKIKLSGLVVDERGIYVSNVDITLRRGNKVEGVTKSGDGGQFEFASVNPGTVLLVAHRLGYRERSLEVDLQKDLVQQNVQLDMASVAANIADVVVEESPGRLQEFIEHRKASKFGHFLDQNEIHKLNPHYLSELFRAIPGARLTPDGSGGSKLILRGCRPKIWIDGVLAQNAEIDDVIAPSEIAGIEIYPSQAGVPAQFLDRENRACGSVIIWSRVT
jgi:hypothetical protein